MQIKKPSELIEINQSSVEVEKWTERQSFCCRHGDQHGPLELQMEEHSLGNEPPPDNRDQHTDGSPAWHAYCWADKEEYIEDEVVEHDGADE